MPEQISRSRSSPSPISSRSITPTGNVETFCKEPSQTPSLEYADDSPAPPSRAVSPNHSDISASNVPLPAVSVSEAENDTPSRPPLVISIHDSISSFSTPAKPKVLSKRKKTKIGSPPTTLSKPKPINFKVPPTTDDVLIHLASAGVIFEDIDDSIKTLRNSILTMPRLVKLSDKNTIQTQIETLDPTARSLRLLIDLFEYLTSNLNWESHDSLLNIKDVLYVLNPELPEKHAPCTLSHSLPNFTFPSFTRDHADKLVNAGSIGPIMLECTKRAIKYNIIPNIAYQGATEVPGFVIGKEEFAVLSTIEMSKSLSHLQNSFIDHHFPTNPSDGKRYNRVSSEGMGNHHLFIQETRPRAAEMFQLVKPETFAPDMIILSIHELNCLVEAARTNGYVKGYNDGRASIVIPVKPTEPIPTTPPAPPPPPPSRPVTFDDVSHDSWKDDPVSFNMFNSNSSKVFNNQAGGLNPSDITGPPIPLQDPTSSIPNDTSPRVRLPPSPSPPIINLLKKKKKTKKTPSASNIMNVDTAPIPNPPLKDALDASSNPSTAPIIAEEISSPEVSKTTQPISNPWSLVGKKTKKSKKDKFIPVPISDIFEVDNTHVDPSPPVDNPFVTAPSDPNPTVRGKPIQIPNPPTASRSKPNPQETLKKSFADSAREKTPSPPDRLKDDRNFELPSNRYGQFPMGVLPERIEQLAKKHPNAHMDALIGLAHNEFIAKQTAPNDPKKLIQLKKRQMNSDQRRRLYIKFSSFLRKDFKDQLDRVKKYFTAALLKNRIKCGINTCTISHRDTIILSLDQIPSDNVVNYFEHAAASLSTSGDFTPRISRFEFSSTLYIPAVPIMPRAGGRRFTNEQYHTELLRNRTWESIHVTSLSVVPIDNVHDQCQLFVNIVDKSDWSIMKSLANRNIFIGQEVVTPRISRSNSEANIPRCDKCQKWGHPTRRCLAIAGICCTCGGKHLTHNHNIACQRCCEDMAVFGSAPQDSNVCRHSPYCANCGGCHPANSTSCVFYTLKRNEANHRNLYNKFATSKPSYEEAVSKLEAKLMENKKYTILDDVPYDDDDLINDDPNYFNPNDITSDPSSSSDDDSAVPSPPITRSRVPPNHVFRTLSEGV